MLAALDERMALDTDVAHLMDALPALARTLRYGDVRGTDVGCAAGRSPTAMLARICVGLPAALTDLDDDGRRARCAARLDGVHAALALLDEPSVRRVDDALARVADRDDLHGLLAGRIDPAALDAGRIDRDEAGRRLALVLTVGVPPARARRAGSRASWPAAGWCWCTTSGCCGWWTAGWPASRRTRSSRCCRCCAARSARSRRRSGGRSASGVRQLGGGGAGAPVATGPHPRGDAVLPTVRALLAGSPAGD